MRESVWKQPQSIRLIVIDESRRPSDRLLGVFEVLAGLLVATQFLVTLPLQVPLQDLLHQEQVGPFGPQEHTVGPQEHIVGPRSPKHCEDKTDQ